MVHVLVCHQRCTAVCHVMLACVILHTLQRRMLLLAQGCDAEFTGLLGVTQEHSLSEAPSLMQDVKPGVLGSL